jgi:glycerol-3-phosphate dehydrogenase
MIRFGLTLYDMLSGHKNESHKILSRNEVLKKVPDLEPQSLKGAGLYHDAIMDDIKLTLEVIFDALRNKSCHALNYVKFLKFDHHHDIIEVTLKDTLDKTERKIRTRELVFALGPFTDEVLKNSTNLNWQPVLFPSKGSHIWIDKGTLPLDHPLVLNTRDHRIIFALPQGNRVLIGTTEIKVNANFFNIKPTEQEITYLLNNINSYFPSKKIEKRDVLGCFAGVRPLIKANRETPGKLSRTEKNYMPFYNVHVIAGGKYTTFRLMGQNISRTIIQRHNLSYNPSMSEKSFKKKLLVPAFTPFEVHKELIFDIIEQERPRTFQDLVYRRLRVESKKHWKSRISNTVPFDDFFLSILDSLREKIQISKDDIINYTN